ncbi:hypothetical protein CALCODRAFT_287946 [Calocera cornea HHB12733]|uniref:Uncharacterized protein n=1 Tax=Calocera cornea HHB12733 TaxID=1353952 RepID=A0A165FUR3_9BASI|nr:hypothetical protein CALCODRAFT_287946 [Calocera cornea HHB12733]
MGIRRPGRGLVRRSPLPTRSVQALLRTITALSILQPFTPSLSRPFLSKHPPVCPPIHTQTVQHAEPPRLPRPCLARTRPRPPAQTLARAGQRSPPRVPSSASPDLALTPRGLDRPHHPPPPPSTQHRLPPAPCPLPSLHAPRSALASGNTYINPCRGRAPFAACCLLPAACRLLPACCPAPWPAAASPRRQATLTAAACPSEPLSALGTDISPSIQPRPSRSSLAWARDSTRFRGARSRESHDA